MKILQIIFVLILLTHTNLLSNQNINKLIGTWKYPNSNHFNDKQKFEKWDKLNDNRYKGVVYSVINSNIEIEEYLELNITKDSITYSATPINQNNGKTINFTTKNTLNNETELTFENLKHDFPQQIIYDLSNDSILNIEVKNVVGNSNENQNMSKAIIFQLTKVSIENNNNSNTKANKSQDSTNQNPNYDLNLAKKLNADDYGMKSYILVILKSGSNQSTDKEKKAESFRGHFENMNKMVEDGKLIVAGPISKNDNNYRGIFILDAADFDEAKLLINNDTAIKNGYLDFELYKWYGSAALPEYLQYSDKIWKVKP